MRLLKQNIKQLRYRVSRYAEMSAANRQGMATPQELNDQIYYTIEQSSPFVAGKIGSNELLVCLWHLEWKLWTRLGIKFSWNCTEYLATGGGIFPRNTASYHEYAQAYIKALGQIDYLGMWHNDGEMKLVSTFAPQAKLANYLGLEPYLNYHKPWTQALADKRVLVVTSFAQTMTQQISNISKVWMNFQKKTGQILIPESASFEVVKFPYGFDPEVQQKYGSWQKIMEMMTAEISAKNFDVAILGCGAYSLLLADRIKKSGKSAIHLGGSTQILFGIRGSRWEDKSWFLENLNDYWTYPLDEDKPQEKAMKNCENACYW